MTKTAIRRTLAASVPAAIIAATAFASASTTVSVPHATLARPVLGARPVFQRVGPLTNKTPRTTFVAGGATLPALAYEGSNALSENPSTPSSGSVFGEFLALTGVTVQYCQTGSGFGRDVFEGITSKAGTVNSPCAALGTTPTTSNGFGAPASLGLTDPDITGTDVPMSQTDYSTFVTNKQATRGEPVSVPSIIGSVALFYNGNNTGVSGQLKLTDAQICSIVEGNITNWNQLSKKYASEPLFFVYRSDGSGTTFSFSNHLVDVCGGSSGLSVSQAFTAPTGTVSVIGATPPANFVGESGNVGVATEVADNPGYIGYVESANALAFESGATTYALVNGKDPIKNLPETAAQFTYSASTVATDSVVNTNGGAATVAALSPAPVKAGCVKIAVPAKYADLKDGYSIIAVTNVLLSTTGNGAANASNLRALVDELNTPADFGSGAITSVDPATKAKGTGKTGYAELGSSFNTPLKGLATKCIGT